MRQRVDFSDPYYRTPARFVARRDLKLDAITPAALEGRKVGVVAGTAHEAYMKNLFTEAELHSYPSAGGRALRAASRARSTCCSATASRLSFWLNGTNSAGCCEFRGGPYLESRYFGEGVGIAVRKGNDLMRPRLRLGAVPAVGERPLHRPVAALFPDQPVLIFSYLSPLAGRGKKV